MTGKICFGLFFAVFAAMAITQPLHAQTIGNFGNGGIKLGIEGPVTLSAGPTSAGPTPLFLTVYVYNHSDAPITVGSLQVVVIDPWKGTPIMTPTVNSTAYSTGWNISTNISINKPIPANTVLSSPVQIELKIPRTVPQTYTSTVNQTWAVIIYAVDNQGLFRGANGWGFCLTP